MSSEHIKIEHEGDVLPENFLEPKLTDKISASVYEILQLAGGERCLYGQSDHAADAKRFSVYSNKYDEYARDYLPTTAIRATAKISDNAIVGINIQTNFGDIYGDEYFFDIEDDAQSTIAYYEWHGVERRRTEVKDYEERRALLERLQTELDDFTSSLNNGTGDFNPPKPENDPLTDN